MTTAVFMFYKEAEGQWVKKHKHLITTAPEECPVWKKSCMQPEERTQTVMAERQKYN